MLLILKKYGLLAVPLAVVLGLVGHVQNVSAATLQLAPLEYRATLAKGEKQRGFIDVSNPTGSTIRVATSVQALRQTDDKGSITFYDSEQLSAGVTLDLEEFDLGPRETLRMYFELDGTKLPSGDVFGAIFLSTQPVTQGSGVGQSIRLGTLLSIINGTPGARSASIVSMNVPFLQFDNTISGSFTIKNTADPRSETGFYPEVSLRAALMGESKKQQGKLVFAGRSRDNEFQLKTPPLGIYKVIAGYKNSTQSRYVLVLTPAAIAVWAGILLAITVLWRIVKRHRRPKRGLHST